MLPSTRVLQNTAQSFPPKDSVGAGPLVFELVRGPILPPRGTKERDRVLRLYDANDYNSLWMGARSGIVKKLSNVSYTIEGPRAQAQYYQDVLGYAHFGHGWEYMLKRVLRDFLTQSYGGIFEIAGPGDPNEPLLSTATSINHLDAGRCYVTGNPIYPILYYSLWDGRLHKMHASRIYMLVDDPNPDERYLGIGTCALERAIAVAQREMRMGQYLDVMMDDKPQPGILSLKGVTDPQWQQLLTRYIADIDSDQLNVFGRTIVLTSIDPTADVKAEPIPFAQTPEKFDFIKYVDLDVSACALALGVDRQELWELAGRSLGSGSQSAVLAMKSRAKLYGDILTGLERFMNWAILPDDCEFRFIEHDAQQDVTQTSIDLQLAQLAQAMAAIPGITPGEIKTLLANRSDTFKDALTNDMGQVTVGSADPQTPGQVSQDAALEGDTPLNAPGGAITPASPKALIPASGQLAARAAMKAADDNRDERFAFEEYEIESFGDAETKDFDPSQQRDESGKWSETGAGEGGSGKTEKPSTSGGKKPAAKPAKPTQAKPTEDKRNYSDYSYAHEAQIAYEFRDATPRPSSAETSAVDRYFSNSGAYALNKPLRTGRPLEYEDKVHAKQLDSLIGRSKLPADVTTYRGIGYGARLEQFKADLAKGKIKPGAVIKDNGYSSTTLDKKVAEKTFATANGGAVFKIKAPKGSRAIYLNAAMDKAKGGFYNHEFRDEKEVLFARGTRYRVDKVTQQGGNYEVEVTILDARPTALKAFSATSADFRNRFTSVLDRAVAGSIRRQQAESIMLSLLTASGEKAYADGLRQGGVNEPLDDDERTTILSWVSDQIDYLDPLLDAAFGKALSPDQIVARSDMWVNKALGQMFNAGRLSADANGMYMFVGTDGKENCRTCKRLKGQIHRLKDWDRKQLIPGQYTDTFECQGWQCKHTLKRVKGAAIGDW